MAAWVHRNFWDFNAYQQYRKYVEDNAPNYKGRTEDCADLSMTLLIDFAANNGLPVTLWDNNSVRYISKATGQYPDDSRWFHSRSWKDKDSYLNAVRRRVGADSLVNQNTVPDPIGPRPGDLMIKHDHASLVYRVYLPTVNHPRAYDKSIPLFPGNEIARTQLDQLEYFRKKIPGPDEMRPNEIDAGVHIDFLNHRGNGKQKAELMYYASAQEFLLEGFQFRMYAPGVIDNWAEWDGKGKPPR